MTNDHDQDSPRPDQTPDELPEDERPGASLADDDEAQEERGRIGYGRNERKSSWLLGLALVLVLAGIGIYTAVGNDDGGGDDGNYGYARIGEDAPDFTMQTFDGEPFTLSEHRGEVVVVNFWGSWCEPCIREMPAFQQVHEASGDDVAFVGVGSKRDPEDKAIAFADDAGVTFPIGLDSEGGTRAAGQITKDYNIVVYPTTFVVDPEGKIAGVYPAEMHGEDLEQAIEDARNGAE